VWLGNSDVVNAGLFGDLTALTPADTLLDHMQDVLVAVASADPLDAVVVGVLSPFVVPSLQPGAFYWYLGQEGMADVADDCAPGTPGSENLLSHFLVVTPGLGQVSCADTANAVVDGGERAAVEAVVAATNASLRQLAQTHRWAFVDPNEVLAPFLSDPSRVRGCQSLAPGMSGPEVAAAAVATCPSRDAPGFFGSLFSLDGVHISAEAQGLLADAIAAALNERHGLHLPVGTP
jgi:hypothetical protein